MLKRLIACALMFPLLSGCGQVMVFGHVIGERPDAAAVMPTDSSSATAPDAPMTSAASSTAEPRSAHEQPAATHVVSTVNLIVAPSAASGSPADSMFATAALLDAIKAELTARGLLDEHAPGASAGTAEIQIDEVTTRPTVNAVVFGRQMLAGTLTGAIHLMGANGDALPDSRLVAEARLGIPVDGSDKNPLGPLYKRFATLAADRLAGVQSKPVNVSADGQPRS